MLFLGSFCASSRGVFRVDQLTQVKRARAESLIAPGSGDGKSISDRGKLQPVFVALLIGKPVGPPGGITMSIAGRVQRPVQPFDFRARRLVMT